MRRGKYTGKEERCVERMEVNMKLVEVIKYEKSSEGIREKQKVLEYMKNGKHFAIAAGPAKDCFTGKSTGVTEECFTDGGYCWAYSVMYHFEKYNTPITQSFIEHVANKSTRTNC